MAVSRRDFLEGIAGYAGIALSCFGLGRLVAAPRSAGQCLAEHASRGFRWWCVLPSGHAGRCAPTAGRPFKARPLGPGLYDELDLYPASDPGFDDFTLATMRQMADGLGVPYELLARDGLRP